MKILHPKDELRRIVQIEPLPIHKKSDGFFYPDYAHQKEIDHYWKHIHISDALNYAAKEGIAVQAGGCVGAWAIELSKYFSKVVTVEADPTVFCCLKNNVSNIPNIITKHAALGVDSNNKIILSTRSMATARVEYESSHGIDVTSIDEIVADDDKVSFIQLDIEGSEFLALLGAVKTIVKWKPVIQIEMRELNRLHGVSDNTIREFLHVLGYVEIKKLPRSDVLFVHKTDKLK